MHPKPPTNTLSPSSIATSPRTTINQIYICIYVYVCVYVYTYAYVCICVYMYTQYLVTYRALYMAVRLIHFALERSALIHTQRESRDTSL